MSLISKTKKTIQRYSLLSGGEGLLVAVSGGADSVALLHVVHALRKQMGVTLTAVHMMHGLRGASAEQDAAFVKTLAKRLRVDFLEGHSNVRALAKRRGISLEMAAREARYALFRKTARALEKKTGKGVVLATAHTADDQAETLILKLARGAGSTGLAAISRKRSISGITTIRPFLEIGREEITRYLLQHKIDWREDESNRDPAFLRNRVRHEVLPILAERLNPNIRGALTRAADILREEDAWMDCLAESMYQECRVPGEGDPLCVSSLRTCPLAARRRVLRLWLQHADVCEDSGDFRTIAEIERVLLGRRGSARVQVGNAHDAVRRYNFLSIVERKAGPGPGLPFRVRITLSGETLLDSPGLRIVASEGAGVLKPKPAGVGTLPAKATLNRDAIGRRAIHVRSWRSGDRMRPLGLRGSVKLQDVFVNAKIPRRERGEVPLFVCGDEIVWVPGYRVARGWEVQAGTRRILKLSVDRT